MAFLFHKTRTRPMPDGAEIIVRKKQRLAQWTDTKGKKQTALVTAAKDGTPRISVESDTWYGRYKDAAGHVIEKNTECKDRGTAQACVNRWAAEVERVKAGVVTASELDTVQQGKKSIADALTAYRKYLTDKGRCPAYVFKCARHVERAKDALGWKALHDLNGTALTEWIAEENFGARVSNSFTSACKAFARWCVRRNMLPRNPFANVEHRNERLDRRRTRRVLTDDELARLFDAAERRPLEKFLSRGKDGDADIQPETRDSLIWLGKTNAICWRVLAGTGLRLNELRSLNLAQCHLDADVPFLELRPEHEKSRRGAKIPLYGELLEQVECYLSERRARLVGPHSGSNVVNFAAVTAIESEKAFPLAAMAIVAFNTDLAYAGVDKGDNTAVADIHGLRHCFATRLAKAGVPVHTAMKLLRHTDPKMTLGIYTHAGLQDMADALASLPDIRVKQDVALDVAQGENGGALRGAVRKDVVAQDGSSADAVDYLQDATGNSRHSTGDEAQAPISWAKVAVRQCQTTHANQSRPMGSDGVEQMQFDAVRDEIAPVKEYT